MAFESENILNGFAPSNYFMLFGLHMSLNSTWDHDEKKPCDDLWSPPTLQCPDDFTPQVQRCPQIPGYSCLGRLVDQSHTRTSFIHIYTCIVSMYVIYITIYIYMPTYPSIHRSIHLSIHPSMLLRVNFPNFPVPSSLTLGDAMHQELRVAATTLVPWSDVVPDEIQNTELIAQV